MELDTKYVNYIKTDLERRGVRSQSLKEDLIDHVCCLVEKEMEGGMNFKLAYLTVLRNFIPLRFLQTETQRSAETSAISKLLCKVADHLMTLICFVMGATSLVFPLTLTLMHQDPIFLLMFLPFILFGPYILITRIDYKKFQIIPFKEKMFQNSIIQ